MIQSRQEQDRPGLLVQEVSTRKQHEFRDHNQKLSQSIRTCTAPQQYLHTWLKATAHYPHVLIPA